jgi:phosphoribosylanthranilate isomerase
MMLIKVCGMRHADNISELIKLQPNYIGFIFYQKSPRFAGDILTQEITDSIPSSIKKTGVFVNESEKKILETVKKFSLNAVQLHGSESPELCSALKMKGLEVLKAFHPDSIEKIEATKNYESACDYFLFDTPSAAHGGTGQKFDWSILEQYTGSCPFFLSGGIGPDDAETILNLKTIHPAGLDINSKFELEPGLKNIDALSRFINHLKK